MGEIKATKNEEKEDEQEEEVDDEEGIELSLGLSLNGKFGVDRKEKYLQRSCSVSNFSITPAADLRGGVPLTRTWSLPVEAEEESMKRKEIQMIRRREAKRRRDEKLRSGCGGEVQGAGVMVCMPPPLSQGSSGSSSGFSEFDCQTRPFVGKINHCSNCLIILL
ncbi:hypothetical protein SOVF_082960 [Spinacia oleracea]|nr:hypothetical protein SOVF_082960 [Spinacia oleracea]